jgi:hypothetical protein
VRAPTAGELELVRMNAVSFNDQSNGKQMPRITYYYTNKANVIPSGKTKIIKPTPGAIACKNLEDQVFSGKFADYRIGLLAPMFDRVKVDVERITDKSKLVPAASIVIEDNEGKAIAVLTGRVFPSAFADGMIKALVASKIPVDQQVLNKGVQSFKRVGALLNEIQSTEKQLTGVRGQLNGKKKISPAMQNMLKNQEAPLAAKLANLQKEMEATRSLLNEIKTLQADGRVASK